jgi:acetoin utilization protein AcuB
MNEKLLVSSVMTAFPYTVESDAPIADARQFMRDQNIRHLPVTENGRLLGLVTDRDIKLVLGPDFDYPNESELSVGEVCDRDPYVVELSESLETVAKTMGARRIDSALIVDSGKLVGVFTGTDACRTLAKILMDQEA